MMLRSLIIINHLPSMRSHNIENTTHTVGTFNEIIKRPYYEKYFYFLNITNKCDRVT